MGEEYEDSGQAASDNIARILSLSTVIRAYRLFRGTRAESSSTVPQAQADTFHINTIVVFSFLCNKSGGHTAAVL